MNLSLDILGKNMAKIAYKSSTEQPLDTFLQDVLFGGAPIKGNTTQDAVIIDYRKYAPHVAEEAVRGKDPNRLNFQSKFNEELITPNYYHDYDEVTLEDADVRVFGEDISENASTVKRVTTRFAEKRDALWDSYKLAKEKMCATCLISGEITNKAGRQKLPMTSALLSIAGSTLYSDFLGTMNTAFETIRNKNKAARPNALILNPTYAILVVRALKAAGLYDKDIMNLGVVRFGGIMGNGAEICGGVNTPGCPNLYIVSYHGVDSSNNYYIPDQKAVLCRLEKGGVGAMAYGRVRAFKEGVGPHYVVEPERFVPVIKGEGDMRTYGVETQTAPFPIIKNLDGYGVLTSIPSSLS